MLLRCRSGVASAKESQASTQMNSSDSQLPGDAKRIGQQPASAPSVALGRLDRLVSHVTPSPTAAATAAAVADEDVRFPVIDLAGNRAENVTKIRDACRDLGFFTCINSGISEDMVEEVRQVGRQFFALPREEKARFPLTFEGGELFGWADVGAESADVANVSLVKDEIKDLMESWQTAPPDLVRNEYPLEGMRRPIEDMYRAKHNVAMRLLELIAESLGLAPDHFDSLHKSGKHRSVLRVTKYPALRAVTEKRGEGVSRISPHQDLGTITILSQDDKGGLEVQDKATGRWLPVKPVANSLVVNLGNLMMRWTNTTYRSSIHRVVSNARSDSEERYSVILFVNPCDHTVVSPLPGTVGPDSPQKYQTHTVGAYLDCKFTQLFDPDAREDKGSCIFDD